jgi:hypothetical protein
MCTACSHEMDGSQHTCHPNPNTLRFYPTPDHPLIIEVGEPERPSFSIRLYYECDTSGESNV